MRAYATLIIALLLASGGCTAAPATEATGAVAPTQPFNVLGPEDAPVTIIEFTDLQCPYCARFATQTFPQLRRNYIDTGRVRFASQDLPLPMHAFAVPAAVAARCAGEQGRFWEFREALFAAQSKLREEPYAELARKFGLDLEEFATCRSDERQTARVREGIDLARANGITSTPTFVIGRLVDGQFQGEKISGAQPYEVIAAKIDALLEAAR
jgi:protein-disulfide isomerase